MTPSSLRNLSRSIFPIPRLTFVYLHTHSTVSLAVFRARSRFIKGGIALHGFWEAAAGWLREGESAGRTSRRWRRANGKFIWGLITSPQWQHCSMGNNRTSARSRSFPPFTAACRIPTTKRGREGESKVHRRLGVRPFYYYALICKHFPRELFSYGWVRVPFSTCV